MGDFLGNESSFRYVRNLAGNPPRRRSASLVGTRWRAVTSETAIALFAKAQRQRGDLSPSGCAFAHGLLRESARRRGCSPAEPRCSPEATALPGGGTVRGHTPGSRPRDATSVPSDRSGGLVILPAAWPPRAAKGNDGDFGRIVSDQTTRSIALSRRFEATLR